ncbi:MAG: hypothetical protein IK092_07000, partial [Muribaculaceae bacterium]|nr:hypothetical protein [Muribaculaceae bacterium]
GYLRLGTGSGNGSVTSPAIDLTDFQGITTARVTAKYYGSDSGTEMKVSLLNSSGDELDSETFTLTNSDAVYDAVLQGTASAGNKIKIENTINRKRVQLKEVQVYGGDATQVQNAPALAPVETQVDSVITVTGIENCYYNVTGLLPLKTYTYKVKAIYGNNIESDWSNLVEVITPEEATFIPGDVNNDGIVNINDITAIVAKVIGGNPQPFNINAADIDGDNVIGVTDITLIVEMVM